MAKEFIETLLEPSLKPEYTKRLRRIEKEGTVSEEEFERRLKVKI